MAVQPDSHLLCGAKLKNGTGHCRRSPVTGRSRCHVHGGATPRGIASPHFLHGRYSKALPVQLAATYEQARRDPELLNLRDEIALIDARMSELLHSPPPLDWGQVYGLIEHRRRVCDSEQKRMLAMHQLLTKEQAMLLVAALVSAVKAHVQDAVTLGRINEEISKIVNKEGATFIAVNA